MTNTNTNNKTHRFELRLTDEEHTRLVQQAEARGMSKARYVTYLLEREAKAAQLGTEGETLYVYPEKDLRLLMWHLAHWGNNLNQAAAAINKLAKKESISDAKNARVLAAGVNEIAKCERVMEKIAGIVERMEKARHIVMKD